AVTQIMQRVVNEFVFVLSLTFCERLARERFCALHVPQCDKHLAHVYATACDLLRRPEFSILLKTILHRAQRIRVLTGHELRVTNALKCERQLQWFTIFLPQLEASIRQPMRTDVAAPTQNHAQGPESSRRVRRAVVSIHAQCFLEPRSSLAIVGTQMPEPAERGRQPQQIARTCTRPSQRCPEIIVIRIQ